MDHISADELKREAPLLSKMEKKEIQEPQGYFEALPDQVLTKLDAPIHEIYKASIWSYVWKVAAGIALLLGLYFLMQPSTELEQSQLSTNTVEINIESDLDYLLEIEDEIFYDVLAEHVDYSAEEELDARIEFLMEEEFELDEIINL
jgi:hypothetical protein